ncbi:DUF167 domain-containing protein [Chlamydia trachomatis]|uniref:UPF0235 protein CT_388 n=5 Tax=Chlamydia trachomatis TaxID=813 RepID=Y388_CHLTR|nr:DUF167 domain-containing protein [Chlamydia trachomatis]NP_219898.3 hypothetical protein CT_388 [Chlamydia trachomatis D/UW-3/CX]B0B7V8.1 RecName: Full=UPF0235 protein CTL0644 [Chlamydia trachomatis 434/Bu]B0BC23.1 RecName: Full=UPF0235 protein CTLon_0641 [Chlamydia trachomatis L2b/UCH-1/proctitis]O84393.1 RecName: Full=UPF0235 protein CT_388 [Chlamydia trachomatis D/UW-3/CX]Q3KLW5.1 RecName: Full=UPF0235 protein CTA_0423 [Chlamydia trachomatis A/HAR-13]AAC67985.1 hypothetical protein CT_3
MRFLLKLLSKEKENILLEGFWVLEVRVTTKARENRVVCLEDGILRVRVTEVPEKGKANDAVVALLANFLSIPKSDVTLIAGEASRRKKVLLPRSIKAFLLEQFPSESSSTTGKKS